MEGIGREPEIQRERKRVREREREMERERRERKTDRHLPLPPPLPPIPEAIPDAAHGRDGSIYIPRCLREQMMRDFQDKSSEAFQRLSWDALRKSINSFVNKVNATNIKNIIPELFSENLIRDEDYFVDPA